MTGCFRMVHSLGPSVPTVKKDPWDFECDVCLPQWVTIGLLFIGCGVLFKSTLSASNKL